MTTKSDAAAVRRDAPAADAAMRRVMKALPRELRATVREQIVGLGREPGRHNEILGDLPDAPEVLAAFRVGTIGGAALDTVRCDGGRAVNRMRRVRFWRTRNPPFAPVAPGSKEDRAEALGFRRWISRGCYAGESRERYYVRRTALAMALDAARSRRARR